MRVIQKAEMIKAQGAKILRFELLLCELGNDRFVVNYRQGLVDGSTYDGSITLRPLSRLDAERAFQKAIEKQSREGYEQLAEGEPPPLPHAPVRAPAAAPLPTPLPTPLPAQPSATTTPAVPALTPEARKAQARARYEKQVLAGLTAALSRTQREGNTALGRAISRADLLRLKKAEPMLLRVARDVSMPKAAMASAVWALGRCGSHQSISTLGALYAEKKTPEQVRRAAAEALMALSDEGTRNEFRASLRLALPDKLRVFAPDSDPEAFQLALSEHLTPNTDEAHAVIDLLYQISDPVSRPALLSYARTMPLKPPVFRRLRHLFRAAEFRRDAELYGLIAYRLELGKAGFQAPRWGNHYEHDLKSGQRACGSRTRTYLRRRVWRTLRMLGQLGDEAFVPMAVGALLPYADSNAQQARTHSSYDYKSRKYTSTEYGPFAAFFTFNKLLFRHSKRFREVPRLLHRERFEKAGKQPREPREEAFPEQWRARPEGLLHLLDESRAGLVHEFAAMTLAECKEFCEGLDLDLLKMLLSKPYEPTAKLGYELARRRYRPEHPDIELLVALATCAYKTAREEGIQLLKQLTSLLAQNTAALATLLLAPHPDTQHRAGEILKEMRLPEASWRALLGRVVAGLLRLGPEDGKRANRVRTILVGLPGVPLGELSETVVRDLMAHPLAEVQAFGGDILFLAKATPTDETIQQLLASPHEAVRAVAARLVGRLPDRELLQRPLVIARLLVHGQEELRDTGRQLARRLIDASPEFPAKICDLLLDALLRNKLAQGVSEWIEKVVLEDLQKAFMAIPPERIARLLRSNNKQAQELGAMLVLERDLAGAFEVDELARLCDHETLVVRQIAWKLMEGSLPRLKADMPGAIRVLDASWEDTRAWAFLFFRERFSAEDFSMEVLVSIHDSVRPEVQAFGRELMGRYFREEDGPQLMLRLSEHPTTAAHLLVTGYLDQFASGEPGYIRGLIPYFQAVLGQVNRGRVARVRVLDFLQREATANEEVAEEVLPLLHRATASIAIETRALALEAIAAIHRAHPTLPMPIQKIAPEVRHGVSLRLSRQLRGREPGRPNGHVLRPGRKPGTNLFLRRAGARGRLPRGDQRAPRRGHQRSALPAQRQERLQGLGGAARRARDPANPGVAQGDRREDRQAAPGDGHAPAALQRSAPRL